MKYGTILLLLTLSLHCMALEKADLVVINKSQHKLFLFKKGKALNSFHVVFGDQPKGHKQQEGDERTPEGKYILDFKKANSAYHRAIHISYPSQADIKHAKKLGLNPGGMIMIHGQKNGYENFESITQQNNWTDGCIALTNSDMDAVWAAVDAGTPIEIKP